MAKGKVTGKKRPAKEMVINDAKARAMVEKGSKGKGYPKSKGK